MKEILRFKLNFSDSDDKNARRYQEKYPNTTLTFEEIKQLVVKTRLELLQNHCNQ